MPVPAALTADALQQQLDTPFPLTEDQLRFYTENGYIKLRHVLSPELLEHYRQAIHTRVADLSRDALPLAQRSTYGKAFLQIMNLWTESPEVREFVFGKRLARIAADLMQVSGVRLYHDQALYKEPAAASRHGTPTSTTGPLTATTPSPHGFRCSQLPSISARSPLPKRATASRSAATSRSPTRASSRSNRHSAPSRSKRAPSISATSASTPAGRSTAPAPTRPAGRARS